MNLFTLYLLSKGGGGGSSDIIPILNSLFGLELSDNATTEQINATLSEVADENEEIRDSAEYYLETVDEVYTTSIVPPERYATYVEMREAIQNEEEIINILENLYLGGENNA